MYARKKKGAKKEKKKRESKTQKKDQEEGRPTNPEKKNRKSSQRAGKRRKNDRIETQGAGAGTLLAPFTCGNEYFRRSSGSAGLSNREMEAFAFVGIRDTPPIKLEGLKL